MSELTALIAPYEGVTPRLADAPAFAGPGAAVLGRATLGTGAWLGAFSVIRADGHTIDIGDDFHLGRHGTVHIAHAVLPTVIGHHVTAGDNAVIHACTVGDDCVVERDAVILDGSIIGDGAVIAAGSIVFPRSQLEGGWLYSGCPAKPVSQITSAEREARHRKTRAAANGSQEVTRSEDTADCFLAPTSRLTGTLITGRDVGVWYGCTLNAGGHVIRIGDGSNVQDNSVLTCIDGDITIGADVTIGHNVTLTDCTVESGSLIGIGAILAPGTHVESDVLVAAGAQSEPGQSLTSGQVWAGRPARPIGPMDERKRAIMSGTLPHYVEYARTFRATPHETLTQPQSELHGED